MIVIGQQFDLHLPGRTSLKEKRSTLRAVMSHLRQRFYAAVSEVAHQDLHQRTLLGIAIVSDSPAEARQRALAIRNHIRDNFNMELIEQRQIEFDSSDMPAVFTGIDHAE